jgi:hypothetical protein
MLRFSKALLVAAVLAGTTGVVVADTWDNPVVPNPIVNNGITIDGNFGDWGVAGTNYTQFGEWNQWYDGNSADYPNSVPGPSSTTTSRLAIDTTNNRLILGIQTTENAGSFEIAGLFGGNRSLEGERVSRFGGEPGDGTQLFVELPNNMTAGDSGNFSPFVVPPYSFTGGDFGGYEVKRNGATISLSADITGATGAYSFDGTNSYIELSIPVKIDWTSADASLANTYDLNDLAGLVGGTGDNNLNIAYTITMFAEDEGFIGDGQNARFDADTGKYGNSHNDDYWEYRAVNSTGVGPNISNSPALSNLSDTIGGLTLVGTPLPEPTTIGLLAAGGLMMLKRRRTV